MHPGSPVRAFFVRAGVEAGCTINYGRKTCGSKYFVMARHGAGWLQAGEATASALDPTFRPAKPADRDQRSTALSDDGSHVRAG